MHGMFLKRHLLWGILGLLPVANDQTLKCIPFTVSWFELIYLRHRRFSLTYLLPEPYKFAQALPLMFWVRHRYNKGLRSKKQQLSWPSLENKAPKVSRFQFWLSNCPKIWILFIFLNIDYRIEKIITFFYSQTRRNASNLSKL